MDFVWAFFVGGALCLIGQLLIDLTGLTPAKILVSYVVIGVLLGGIGIYEPLVEFAGADTCACCGTHVKFTGEIGMVKFVSCIKFKEGVRIELASGQRALRLMQEIFEQNRQVSQTFSAKLLETGTAAQKFNEMLMQEKYRAVGLQRKLFAFTADSYAGAARALHFEEGLNPGQVRELADAIAEKAETAIVLSGTDEAGYAICIISKTADTRELGKAVNQNLNGRGGGKPGAFQGSIKATRAQVEEFFK